MKQIFTLLFFAITSIAFGQDPMYQTVKKETLYEAHLYKQPLPINSSTGRIEFQKVIEVENLTQSELYTLAREWCAKTFVSANAVLQMDDKNAGVLIAKGILPPNGMSAASASTGNIFTVDLLLKIEAKDGRYRYTISDITHSITVSNEQVKRSAEELLSDENLYKSNGKPVERFKKAKEMLLISVSDIETSLSNYISSNNSIKDNW